MVADCLRAPEALECKDIAGIVLKLPSRVIGQDSWGSSPSFEIGLCESIGGMYIASNISIEEAETSICRVSDATC